MELSIRRLFGERIKHLRLASGMSQEAFADATGLARSYMSRIERGEANPSLDAVEILAKSLKVEVKSLFEFAEIKPRKQQQSTRINTETPDTIKKNEYAPPRPVTTKSFSPKPISTNKSQAASTTLVPIAKDGSYFNPGLRRPSSGTFMVGEKGHELTFRDFDDALKYLSLMDKARWRRPNSNGNWGIVAAVRWDKLPL